MIFKKKLLKSWLWQVRFLLNTCLTVMEVLVQSGYSRQDHHQKKIHSMKQTTNSAAARMTTSCTISWRRIFFRFKQRGFSYIHCIFLTHIKNESMNNVIAYVVTKNTTMAHSMILKNRISWVVGISIFGFKIYWKQVLNLMEIQTTRTFEQFLQAETLNVEKNKSYYQYYNVKQLRDFHKKEMMKQQIYDNMLARWSGMEYSPGI